MGFRLQFLTHPTDVFAETASDRGDCGIPVTVELRRDGQYLDRFLQGDLRLARSLNESSHGPRQEAFLE